MQHQDVNSRKASSSSFIDFYYCFLLIFSIIFNNFQDFIDIPPWFDFPEISCWVPTVRELHWAQCPAQAALFARSNYGKSRTRVTSHESFGEALVWKSGMDGMNGMNGMDHQIMPNHAVRRRSFELLWLKSEITVNFYAATRLKFLKAQAFDTPLDCLPECFPCFPGLAQANMLS